MATEAEAQREARAQVCTLNAVHTVATPSYTLGTYFSRRLPLAYLFTALLFTVIALTILHSPPGGKVDSIHHSLLPSFVGAKWGSPAQNRQL